jgi:hypothetical protein
MSITYASYVSQLANIMVVSSADANFATFLPGAIDYAEGRVYRDLNLVAQYVTDASGTCSSGTRTLALSTASGTYLVVEQVSILTSAGAPSSAATRNQLYAVSPDYINATYPSAASSNTGQPAFWARLNDTTIMFGPAPDQPYGVEVYGTQRPTPLSSANSSTWLTQNVPELFMAATMVFATGYMRDFGAQSDNPQMAQSWEQTYRALLETANRDELRKKFYGPAWTAAVPSPLATPPRA